MCVYFNAEDRSRNSKQYDYKVVPGELWDENFGRYKIRRLLGQGSFGQVVEAVNLDDNTPVAIKIINRKRQYYEQAKEELRYLKILNKHDSEGLVGEKVLVRPAIAHLKVFDLLKGRVRPARG